MMMMETIFPTTLIVQETEITYYSGHHIQLDTRHPPKVDHHDAVVSLDWLQVDPLLIIWQHLDPDV